jgi:hypothetical protein
MNKYAIGGDFTLPSDGTHVALASISLSAGTYRIAAGAYAHPTNTYTISGYDSVAFPIYQPHFQLPSRYGAEDYNLLDLGIFVLAETNTITLYGYNEYGAEGGGSMTVLIADAATV